MKGSTIIAEIATNNKYIEYESTIIGQPNQQILLSQPIRLSEPIPFNMDSNEIIINRSINYI